MGSGHGASLWLPGGPLRARPAWGHSPLGVGWCLVLLVAVDRLSAGERGSVRLAVAIGAVLAALDPGDRVAGVLPGGPLGGRAGHRAERLLGVGDAIGAAVVLDGGGGLSPGPPPPGALRYRAELAAEVTRLLLLGGHGGGAALPG